MKVRTTKTRPPRPRGRRVTANARRANPLRRDPTRTAGIRRRWEAEVRRRFARLKAALYRLVVDEDAFGLAPPASPFTTFVTHGFFSDCARDERGHCLPGTGGAFVRIKAGVAAKIPDRVKSLAAKIGKAAYIVQIAGNKAVQAVARQRGLSEQQVGKLSKVVAAFDVALGGSRSGAAATAVGLGGLAAPAAFVPWGSVGYLAYSTARNPLATLRAAKAGVKAVLGKLRGGKATPAPAPTGNVSADLAATLADALAAHDFDDWYAALLFAALDETVDPHEAVALADAAFAEQPDDPDPEARDDDAEAVFSDVTANARFSFQTSPQQLQAFKAWLAGQVDSDVMGRNDDTLWRKYVEEGFKQGAARAFTDVRKPAAAAAREEGAAFYEGGKEEFLRSAFARPVAAEKVQLLASRTLNELEGVTDQMATAMVRTLADGLVRGSSPREIAADLSDDVGIARDRSLTIARTELIRAHSDGQLVAMEALGVETLGVQVEVLVTDDDRLCPICADLAGRTFTLEEAQGLIPVHPNCRCTFTPSGVGESEKEPGKAVTNARRCVPPHAAPPCDCTPALLEFSRWVSNCGGQGGTPGPCPSGKKEPSARLSRLLRPGAKVGEAKQSKPPPKAEAESAAPGTTPAPSSKEAVTHLAGKVAELDRAGGGFNLVHLADLRAAHPEWSRREFDDVLQRARGEGKVTLSAAEGRHGLTARDQDAAVHEAGSGGTRRTLLFASVRG